MLAGAPLLAEVDTDTYKVAPAAWVAFFALIGVLLLVDLLLVHRKPHAASTKEAAIESAVWISIGVAFTFVILAWQGSGAAGEYLSAYLIEKSLSVDNVFVWAVIFSFFAVPAKYQHRVLFWGIFGALVMRFAFIFAGVALLTRFEFLLFIFGGFLLFTAYRMVAKPDEQEVDPERSLVLRLVRRVVPSTTDYDGQRLFTHVSGRRLATPLFAVLVLVETTDVLFAVDSVPAVLGVSREQFIVLTSNAFAILGLRALYFLLGGMHDRFAYLKYGLALILAFVGVKMILSRWYHLPIALSLGFIAVVLTASIWASLRKERRDGPAGELPTP